MGDGRGHHVRGHEHGAEHQPARDGELARNVRPRARADARAGAHHRLGGRRGDVAVAFLGHGARRSGQRRLVDIDTKGPVWERFFTVAPLVLIGTLDEDGERQSRVFGKLANLADQQLNNLTRRDSPNWIPKIDSVDDGIVVTGDVGGVRFPGADRVCPPMPPPDIDVNAWVESLALIRDLSPERLLLTHFGAFVDVGVHQDGLVHISAMSHTFIDDPSKVVKAGDIVKVKVMDVDVARKRIAEHSLTRSAVLS